MTQTILYPSSPLQSPNPFPPHQQHITAQYYPCPLQSPHQSTNPSPPFMQTQPNRAPFPFPFPLPLFPFPLPLPLKLNSIRKNNPPPFFLERERERGKARQHNRVHQTQTQLFPLLRITDDTEHASRRKIRAPGEVAKARTWEARQGGRKEGA